MTRHRRSLLLLALLLLLGLPANASARAVGVTLDEGPRGPAESFRLFTSAGANALEAPQPWSELEPSRGRYRVDDVASIVDGVRSTPAARVMLIPAAIETTARSVPSDLLASTWDSARMIDRYRRLISALRFSRQVTFVSIANEADVYFTAHPGELPAFTRFARSALRSLKRRAPWVRAGVTVTFNGLHTHAGRVLARLGDARILTYYPLGDGYQVRPPSSPLTDLPALVTGARPLVIQEAGYPSSPQLGSSPAAQATFVRSVFAAAGRIPFLSIYSLFDLPASACRSKDDATAFLCSLGLRDRRGRAKPAWREFVAGV